MCLRHDKWAAKQKKERGGEGAKRTDHHPDPDRSEIADVGPDLKCRRDGGWGRAMIGMAKERFVGLGGARRWLCQCEFEPSEVIGSLFDFICASDGKREKRGTWDWRGGR